MKVNSEKGLAQGRDALKEHGGSWAKVRESGKPRADGVVVVRTGAQSPSKPKK